MLEAISLSHTFDNTLFEDVNLHLNPKSKTAILGVSGSGKSTLLHILSTFLIPTKGKVLYNGKSIYELSDSELLKIKRYEFGLIFQQHYLFRGFSALENLQLPALLTGSKIDNTILQELKIDKVINNQVSELSGGQQQRVSIARVMLKKPKIIFADEPTGNLDKDTANDVWI